MRRRRQLIWGPEIVRGEEVDRGERRQIEPVDRDESPEGLVLPELGLQVPFPFWLWQLLLKNIISSLGCDMVQPAGSDVGNLLASSVQNRPFSGCQGLLKSAMLSHCS